MKNIIKMNIFKDESSPLRSSFTKELPPVINSFNTQILYKENSNEHNMIQLTPNFRSLYFPISFDVLFLTGEYAGLLLDKVKPYRYDPATKQCEEFPIDIIPEKAVKNPPSYEDSFYQFRFGGYYTNYISFDILMDMYNEIRQWDTISLESITRTINQLNGIEKDIDK